ncbi:MAG TPA: hypothetical protein ENN66_09410 [Proteobacteria bacterium]|nr:hypothetical protein [Pseudomonadota bacterium]
MQLSFKQRRLCHFHGNRIYYAAGWRGPLEALGLTSGKAWDRLDPGKLVTGSRRTNVYLADLGDGRRVYFKRHLLFGKPFRFFLRPSTAAVELFSYKTMKELGIPVAEPVAIGEIRRWGSLFAACIVTREIPQSLTLKDYALTHWLGLSPQAKGQAREALTNLICRHLRLMHDAGFFHFDPKWRNLLVRPESSGKIAGVWWIDSPRGNQLPAWLHDYGRVHDLASLCRMALFFLSRSQRLRFLHDYCGPSVSRRRIRKLVLQIDRHLQRNPPKPIQPSCASTTSLF